MKNAVPSWFARLLSPTELIVFSERSILDPKQRWMRLESENTTFSSIVCAKEVSKFWADPDAPQNSTYFYQEGIFEASSWFGLAKRPFERFCVPRFFDAAVNACKILDKRIDQELAKQ